MNTGGVLSPATGSPELPDLITTTQWKSLELMPIPGGNFRTSSHKNTYCFSKWARAHWWEVSNWLWNTFDQFLRSFNSGKKLLAGKIICKKWPWIICYPRSQNLQFSYLFVNFLSSGFPLMRPLFLLKAFNFSTTLEMMYFLTKQVLTG